MAIINNSGLHTSHIQVPNGDLQISAYLARPADEASYPGVVVLQEVFGVNAHIREVTERIARLGYVAIAPALFQRQVDGFEADYQAAGLAQGRAYVANTTASELLSDIQACMDYLKTLPQVLPQFGCVGFCFGGHVAYLAATLPDIQVTAAFYGRGIPLFTFGNGPPSIERTAQIHGDIYLFFGEADSLIPLTEVETVRRRLTQENIKYRLFTYPNADHGFFCDHRSSYNPTAAADAWLQVQELLQLLR